MLTKEQAMMENAQLRQGYTRIQLSFLREQERNKELHNEINSLKDKVCALHDEIRGLTEALERCRKADGRPSKYNWQDKGHMMQLRTDGWSIAKIAEHYGCSTSTVHKIEIGRASCRERVYGLV